MPTKEEMVRAIRVKTESCIASYLKRSSLKSSHSLATSDGKHSDRMIATFEKTMGEARREACRMVCTWLSWSYSYMPVDDLVQLVVDAGHERATVEAMRERMTHCSISGPDKECHP